MSEAILRDDPNKDLEVLINEVHKHFKGRIKSIEDRFDNIEKSLLSSYQGDASKVKDFSKAKKISKSAIAAAAKTAANVELIASQEEVLAGNNLGGLGLADKLKKGAPSKGDITDEDSSRIVELAAKMKNEFSHKLDAFEKRIDTIDSSISSYKKSADKEKLNQPIEQRKMGPVNDLDKAYALINEMYQDLTKRFDSLEKKLDKVEKKIEKEMPGIKLESKSKVRKSIISKAVDGIKGLFKSNQSNMNKSSNDDSDLKQSASEAKDKPINEHDINGYEPTADELLYELEAKARERAEELGIEFKGGKQEPFKDSFADLMGDKTFLSSKHNDNILPDDLDDFTYNLMEGIAGEKNMTFERDVNIPNNRGSGAINAMEEAHRFDGEEPKPLKIADDNFKFGKFDANVILKEIENRSDDEFKEHLYSKYADSDKADSDYEMQVRRIEKLKEKGYIEKENGKYIITDKGKEAVSEVNKSFQFTSYDTNVIFGYINKNNGQLSLEKLKESIGKEYKTKDEIDKQFSYLQKRLENNERAGFLAKNEAGHYVITDKGKTAANRIELKKNKRHNLAL